MPKPGPKENLIEGQENRLNKMFYRDYMIEYFDEKIMLYSEILSNSGKYVNEILSKELNIGELKFKSNGVIEKEKFEKYAKCEIVETYYHCLETFMRLFIAHASFPKCPLIELTALEIREYHKIINKIVEGDFENLNNKFNGDDTVLMLLIGSQKKDGQIEEKNINNLKEWIIFCARELKNMNEYNSFKHGLTMFAGFGAMEIKNLDNQTIVSKKGDAVHILESKEQEKQYKFGLTNIFVEYDYKATLIIFFNEMIKNIITIGNIRYVTEDYNTKIDSLHFANIDYFELNKIFSRDSINQGLESYSEQLFYKDDLKEEN